MAQTKKKAEEPMYFWWHGKDLCPMWEYVAECGGLENVRIEFRPEEKELHVIPLAEADAAGYRKPDPSRRRVFNYTHTCPPKCNGG